MKVHDCIQGTTEWLQLRAGIPTASEFSNIITPKTGKPSASAEPYMHRLIAERLMQRPVTTYVSFYMERGSEMEAEAVRFYEFQREIETETVGFVTNDDETVGASPDRLVGDEGLLEIKCPAEHTQIAYLLWKPVEDKYRAQAQGQLWVTGRKWCDLLAYHPELPPALVRVERDEEYIGLLSAAVTDFSKRLEQTYQELVERVRWDGPETPELSALDVVRGELAKMSAEGVI